MSKTTTDVAIPRTARLTVAGELVSELEYARWLCWLHWADARGHRGAAAVGVAVDRWAGGAWPAMPSWVPRTDR